MAKEEIMLSKKVEIERGIIESKNELLAKLEKKLDEKTKELKELEQEAGNLLTELDSAYKELRSTQEELIIKEKLSVAGGLAAGVAHEVRNSLSIIGMSVQYLHNKFSPEDERRKFTETIMERVEKLNSVATDLIHFARPCEPNFQKSDLHRIVDRTLRLVECKCNAQKIKVVKKYAPNLPLIVIDEELMGQVFLNLIDNALWAMPKGGNLIIATSVPHETNSVEIKVTDTGCGISRKDCPRIFDPFFTRRDNGTGLGLSIVHQIIEQHKGCINVESEQNKGTTFIIRLPTSPKK